MYTQTEERIAYAITSDFFSTFCFEKRYKLKSLNISVKVLSVCICMLYKNFHLHNIIVLQWICKLPLSYTTLDSVSFQPEIRTHSI